MRHAIDARTSEMSGNTNRVVDFQLTDVNVSFFDTT